MTTLKIQHRRHEECVLLRADYLALCQGDRCAALLLALSEHWSNVRQGMMVKEQARAERARQRGQTPKPSNGPYFYKTYADFGDDLLGLYGETAISESLGKLVAWGFVLRRRNPHYRRDRTYQYTLDYAKVQAALDALHPVSAAPKTSEVSVGERESEPALPLPTTEITPPAVFCADGADPLVPVVARYLFDLDLPLEAAAAKRVGLLVRWLHQHGASDQDVGTFVRWYRKRHPGAALPRAEATFAEHWTRSKQPAQAGAVGARLPRSERTPPRPADPLAPTYPRASTSS